jgi:phosphoribosyl-ATP pyrophosphohydrolase/phosphoribosyl-AMP cyclohydrolase
MKIEDLKFDSNGLIPAIIQDARTRRILMLAYMSRESLARTIDSGETWFWSRSRSQLWHKGETSGNTQQVVNISPDCDGDAITLLVNPKGPACHTGAESCFDSEGKDDFAVTDLGFVIDELYALVEERKRELPQHSYTTYLFKEGLDKILKKLAEECGETIIAAKNEDQVPLIKETADLLYHLVVLLVERNVSLNDVSAELRGRRRKENE